MREFDSWSTNFPYTGNNYGDDSWYEEESVLVNDSGDKYGAKMNRGEAYVGGNDWCYTGVPTVDNVEIT